MNKTAEKPQDGYRSAFPDFDRGDLIDMLVKAGWKDESWHNDGCPRVHCGDALIWLDYVDESKRVCSVAPPFHVEFADENGAFVPEGKGSDHQTIESALGAIYAEVIGYDPFADNCGIDAATVAQTLAEHAAEGGADRYVVRANPRMGGFNIVDKTTGEAVAHRHEYSLALAYVEQARAEA